MLCYIDVFSFININGSVCGPVTLSRGIKQGDSISSQLYIYVNRTAINALA